MDSEMQCTVCHIGTRHERRATYTQWVEGQLALLPDVPVWVCDVCDDVEFDEESIAQLEMLLGIDQDDPQEDEPLGHASSTRHLFVANRRRSAQFS